MFVLDASVALAWLLPDESTAAARTLLDRSVGEGAVAPSIWPIELASALLTAQRRKRISPQNRRMLLERLAALPVACDAPPTFATLQTLADLANEHGISVYDACYLGLALDQGLSLATFDGALRAAASRAGVATLPA